MKYYIFRGGSWGYYSHYCPVADRRDYTHDDRNYDMGFRLTKKLKL